MELLQKTKNRAIIWANPLLGICPKEWKSVCQRDILSCSLPRKGGNWSPHPGPHGFFKCDINMMESYSALKRQERPSLVTVWVNLGDTMQVQRDKEPTTHWYFSSEKVELLGSREGCLPEAAEEAGQGRERGWSESTKFQWDRRDAFWICCTVEWREWLIKYAGSQNG